MKKFIAIMLAEYKNFISDKGVMLIMIAAIVLYSFWYVMPYDKEVIKEIPIGIVDLDQTNSSHKFVRNFDATDILKIETNLPSIQESEKEFYKGKIKGFIVIPQNYERDILRGKQVDISLYADSAYLVVYKTIYTAVLQAAMETGGKIEIAKMMKSGIPKKQAMAMKQPFEYIQVPLFNPAGGYKSYVYPIILIMILHQTLLFGMGMLQGTRTEKKIKYCKNPKDMPITILARSTAFVILYFFYGLIAFFIFPELFVYPTHYNVIPLLSLYLLMLYTTAFFAQTLSYCFRIREAVLLVMVASSLIFVFIPGLIWPRESIPDIINIISFFIPATCGVDGIIKLNQNGASCLHILYDYIWLLFLCLFYYMTAIMLTKKTDERIEKVL